MNCLFVKLKSKNIYYCCIIKSIHIYFKVLKYPIWNYFWLVRLGFSPVTFCWKFFFPLSSNYPFQFSLLKKSFQFPIVRTNKTLRCYPASHLNSDWSKWVINFVYIFKNLGQGNVNFHSQTVFQKSVSLTYILKISPLKLSNLCSRCEIKLLNNF